MDFNPTKISKARRTQTFVTKNTEVALPASTFRGNTNSGEVVSGSLPRETVDILGNFRSNQEPLFFNRI